MYQKLALLGAIVIGLFGISRVAAHDAQKQSLPSRPERPVAAVHEEVDPPAEMVLAVQMGELDELYNEVHDAEIRDWVRAEEERQAAEAAAEAARMEAARPAPGPATTSGGNVPSSCDGHVVPAYIVQRESGCNYGAVNPTGCGGASCVGLYQFDLRHFTSGACAGLDWHSPADQDECARRISNNGTNLRPWGG